jgi:hypothetical protein
MDDGSRDTRFAPFFANTGFYFLKHHYSTLQFWDHTLMSSGYVINWRSNQEVVNWMLEEHHTRFSMDVKILPPKVCASLSPSPPSFPSLLPLSPSPLSFPSLLPLSRLSHASLTPLSQDVHVREQLGFIP